jgi:diguanylate cyclase (GGDEF)-like protein/PAS domain S-box-containing protein
VTTTKHALQLIADHPGVVIMISGDDRTITYISDSVTELLGYKPSELIGTLARDLVHPDDLPEMLRRSDALRNEPGSGFRMTSRLRHVDGSWRWVASSRRNLLDDPLVAGIVSVFIDVTEATEAAAKLQISESKFRAMAEALAASEERYRNLVQRSDDPVIILAPDGEIRYASDAIERMLGHRAADLVGTSAIDLLHPDDMAVAVDRLRDVLEGVEKSPLIVRARTTTSEWRWLELTGTNVLDEASVDGVIVNIRDVSERLQTEERLRMSEARFRALVQHASDTIEIINRDGTYAYVSPAITPLTGFTEEELIGQTAGQFVHPDDRAAVLGHFQQVMQLGPDQPVRFEARIPHRDGSVRWVDCIMTNHLDDPVVSGVVANVRDISASRQALQALQRSESLFRTLASSSPIGIYRVDDELGFGYVNERFCEIAGVSGIEEMQRVGMRIFDRDDFRVAAREWERTGALGLPYVGQSRLRREDGRTTWVSIRTSPLRDEHGRLTGHVGTVEDITERVDAARDTARLTEVLSATSDLVAITDREGVLLYLNEAAQRFFNVDEATMASFDFIQVTPRWAQDRYANETLPALSDEGIWSGEFAYNRDGVEVPVSALFISHRDDDGHLEFVSSITRDISEQKAFEDQLAHQATHDPLTGLPNRVLLLDRLQMALARSGRSGATVGVLFLDLDHFKVVNDSLGHSKGDALLVAIAERLKGVVRPGDTVARFGGDEFVILCEDVRSDDDGLGIAQRVEQQLAAPIRLDENDIYVTASAGLATASGEIDGEALIRDADAAMYRAKDRGRARFEVFDAEMRHTAVDRLDVESALRRAIDHRELRVAYQPKIDLLTGEIVGAEALLRWEHPERGLLPPLEFLQIAEETGLIIPIGAWIFEQACRQAVRWRAEIPELWPLFVCVNLSGRQLQHPSLVSDLRDIVDRTGADPAYIDLEITESVAMHDVQATAEVFAGLKEIGFKLAIDDFGTGYSSLAYLRRFPVDFLKVDRAFVDGLEDDASDVAIVRAVVSMAHSLGLQVIAEGVETGGQLARLREMGCDMAQGFTFAKPMPCEDLTELLRSRPRW